MSMNPDFNDPQPRRDIDPIVGDSIVLAGHEMFDAHHEKVGKVTDVLYDENGSARWAVVNPGPLHRERYVPVDGSFMTDAGQVVVPFTKDVVKGAHPANRDHILDRDLERELEQHYALPQR